ncbi:MAG: U32 family peptidase [Alphaproteobacteria bacterium]
MSMMQQTELLAPAGDPQAGYAALFYGADAVYLGLPKFSARAGAVNFTAEQLDEFVAYAHSINRKVYVAMNTLVQESELPETLEALQICRTCGVDAVIVQDLGIARIVHKCFPDLQLHASTQMAIHNSEGALALKQLGFSRVVLARELTLPEIIRIRDCCPLETEVFIHGALCYSYSGLCSFSSFQTTRSANRGKCVYSCRDLFTLNNRQTHLFSMKDMALESDILKLKGLSLKIEGRKKNALYVAAVTNYYRRILDTGRADISLADDIRQIFSRPWTKLHFHGKNKQVIDPDFVGHRGLKIGIVEKITNHVITITPDHPIARYDGIQIETAGREKPFGFSAERLSIGTKSVFEIPKGKTGQLTLPDLHPFIRKGDTVYLASSSKVKSTYRYETPKPGAYKNRTPISVCVFVEPDKIIACHENETVQSIGNFSPARDVTKAETAIRTAFEKTGDTTFTLAELIIQNPHNLFVPVSALNDLRRKLYSRIKITPILPVLPKTATFTKQNAAPKWFIKTDDVTCLADIDMATCDEIWPVADSDFDKAVLGVLPFEKVRICLPPVIRQSAKMNHIIRSLWSDGYRKFAAGNLSALTFLPDTADIIFDSFIPVLNTQSLSCCLEMNATGVTLSPEDTFDNIQKLIATTDKAGVILYQDIPLFISANCVRPNDCADCTQRPWQADLSGTHGQFTVISKKCQTYVLPKQPLCWAQEMKNLNAGFYRVDFCYNRYTPATAADIWNRVRNGQNIQGSVQFNLKKQFA